MRLDGRTALVTGASGEIGWAIAAALAERGATIGVVGRRRARLERLVRRLPKGEHCVLEVDLTSDTEVRALARSVTRRFGHLDILVHSNGVYASAPLDRARLADFDRLWSANVRSPFLLTQLLIPTLKASRGQIVFVCSSVSLYTRPGVGQYAATQHALHALAETARAELNDDGVRVLAVYPGRTATERMRRIFKGEGRPYAPERLLQPADLATVVAESLVLPSTAEVTVIHVRSATKQ
jgi:NAD(P)-dependent dehydrogenase (short-subunit alcohol dehydrogenase family)